MSQPEFLAEIALNALVSNPGTPNQENDFDTTYIKWKTEAAELAFIYDYVLNKRRLHYNRVTLAVLILSSMVTLISSIQFGIDQCHYSGVLTGIQVVLTVGSLLSTILGGYLSIFGVSQTIDSLQRYVDKVESFYTVMADNDSLPKEGQFDRKHFVISNKDRHSDVIRNAPSIGRLLHKEALIEFKQSKDALG